MTLKCSRPETLTSLLKIESLDVSYVGLGFPDDNKDLAGRDRFFEERGLQYARDFNDHEAAFLYYVEGDSLVIEFGKRRLDKLKLSIPGRPAETWEGEGVGTSLRGGQHAHKRIFARYRKIS